MPHEPEERLARDLYKAGELHPPIVVGTAVVRRLLARMGRRPAGSSPRLWTRVAGEDPFVADAPSAPIARKTVYADGRFVRLEADGSVPARGSGPSKVTPPRRDDSAIPAGFRDVPTAPRNQGESLIPPGFRDVPVARAAPTQAPSSPRRDDAPRGEDLIPPGFRDLPTASARPKPASDAPRGEDLIPPGFRDLPVARAEPPPRPKPADQPAPPPLPERPSTTASGRIRQRPRQRRVIRTPRTESAPSAAAPAPPPLPTPPAPEPTTPTPPDPGGNAVGLDDLFAGPREGRARMRRKKPGEE